MAGVAQPATTTSNGAWGTPAHPQLRVTDGDREQVVELVTAAYAEGRLDKVEFDERLHLAMTARTHADLAPIARDVQAPYAPGPAPRPAYWSPPRRAMPLTGGDRMGAIAAHLLPFCGLSFVAPLVVLLTAGKNSVYVREHAVEALNFQLTLLGATILLPITVIGVILVPFLWIAAVVLGVVATVNSLSDTPYRYPWTVRLVK
ncbi:DUF1707 and DUF4870 domain-containing protein [Sphaerisporangium sp. TRM90804]|uniref:DUF1707 and DUF4870 domain-containing protein n=1 Tax=Sphaerisporangium sp. TRM90804 TaxID=3031113 RepID=UPI0024494D14|nr:DUF1707 and DUF4870 domain-containing protein [Sphaerisporangium sp. TRM90804]MDH2428192.1 DUF1707 and DUF4870 domain-containing protein [Sphaerisporangium sp. TRM90804]